MQVQSEKNAILRDKGAVSLREWVSAGAILLTSLQLSEWELATATELSFRNLLILCQRGEGAAIAVGRGHHRGHCQAL